MGNKYQTIKIWKTTLVNLRLLAALKGMPIVKIIDKFVKEALAQENKKKGEEL